MQHDVSLSNPACFGSALGQLKKGGFRFAQ